MKLPEAGKEVIIGYSVEGRAISLVCYGRGPLSLLMLAGVHGNESEGYLLAERICKQFASGVLPLPEEVSLYICSRLNPDGCQNRRRSNHHNVDLNRNLPTHDWSANFQDLRYYPGPEPASEPETQVTIQLIEATRPTLILSLHSYEQPMVNYNGDCADLAKTMGEKNGLPARADIGYPTPGSLGTYAGHEKNIATITLEILRGEEPQSVWENHLNGLLTAIGYYVDHPR